MQPDQALLLPQAPAAASPALAILAAVSSLRSGRCGRAFALAGSWSQPEPRNGDQLVRFATSGPQRRGLK